MADVLADGPARRVSRVHDEPPKPASIPKEDATVDEGGKKRRFTGGEPAKRQAVELEKRSELVEAVVLEPVPGGHELISGPPVPESAPQPARVTPATYPQWTTQELVAGKDVAVVDQRRATIESILGDQYAYPALPLGGGFDERDGLPFEAYVSAAEHELRRLGMAWASLPAANELMAFLREVLQRVIHKEKSKEPAVSAWASSILKKKVAKLHGLYDDANKNIEVAKSITEHATEHRGELTGGEILYREADSMDRELKILRVCLNKFNQALDDGEACLAKRPDRMTPELVMQQLSMRR
jgi:hypothetical protein